MNELGKGSKGDAIYQISNLYAIQFQKRKILKMGFFVPMFQLVTPPGGASFDPRPHMKKLGRYPQGDAIYHISKL